MARKNEVQYVNFYTAGSAAYQYDPMPLPKKQEAKLPKPRRQKRIRIVVDPVAVLGVVVGAVMLVMMISGMVRLQAVKQQQAEMAAYVQRLEAQNEQLRATYEQGYDLDEIYEIATAMGMIPAQQAQRVQVNVTVPEAEQEMTVWESFCTFLTGLFA